MVLLCDKQNFHALLSAIHDVRRAFESTSIRMASLSKKTAFASTITSSRHAWTNVMLLLDFQKCITTHVVSDSNVLHFTVNANRDPSFKRSPDEYADNYSYRNDYPCCVLYMNRLLPSRVHTTHIPHNDLPSFAWSAMRRKRTHRQQGHVS